MRVEELGANLSAAGLQSRVLNSPGGGRVTVTPHGARVLGLFAGAGENLYWVNPELASADAAKKLLAGEHVLGGDRCWLAPERGLFFKGEKLADGVTTQREIDPGNWIMAHATDSSVRLINEFSAEYFHKKNSRVRGVVDRTIRVIPSPFVHGAVGASKSLAAAIGRTAYAGYEIASTLRLIESPHDELHFGLWFLIQLVVPDAGFLYVPTAGRAVITGDYYEPTGADYLKVTDSPHAHVRFKLDSIDRHKIGIRATEVLGRAAFLSNASAAGGVNGKATLVVRNFLNNPSAHYSDVPLHTPKGTQDSVQSYNHNTGPSGFGELEFHTPGINRAMAAGGSGGAGGAGGDPFLADTNQVWAFTGVRADLVEIAAVLLNLPPETFAV